jgi:hypothetical protein
MAALKLAIKLNEPRRLNMDDMLRMGKGMMGWLFNFNDVVGMEQAIIMHLFEQRVCSYGLHLRLSNDLLASSRG